MVVNYLSVLFRIVVQSIWEKGRLDMTILSWSLLLACCLPHWLSLCFVNVGTAPASFSAFFYLVRCLLVELTHNFCSHRGLYYKFSDFLCSSSVAFSRLLIQYQNSQPSNITSNSLRVQKREKKKWVYHPRRCHGWAGLEVTIILDSSISKVPRCPVKMVA